ncbi:tau 95 subunit of transcription factor TFIIIC [Entophlyctis sp. JEL0112]|nr:tau 95 subunit of transcription factor TFIIIC [Entophlyctis sp. JEL0112]
MAADTAPVQPLRNWQFHAIELPGRIVSQTAEAAIESLGGLSALAKASCRASPSQSHSPVLLHFPSQAFSSELAPLELRLRPDDPFSHPVLGEVVSTANLLLKVTRKRRKKGSGPGGEHLECDYRMESEILGIITKTGRFRALADFQYVVDSSDPMLNLKKSLDAFNSFVYLRCSSNEILLFPVEGISNFEFARDRGVQPDLRCIPPPVFSRMEWSLAYRYQKNAAKPDANAGQRTEMSKPSTYKRKIRHPILQFSKNDTSSIPQGPTPEILAATAARSPDPELLAHIEALFAKRPMYTLRALTNSCKPLVHVKRGSAAEKLVSVLVTRFAYMFLFGPWQDCWTRYGYDPREDVEARMYQIIGMRFVKTPVTFNRAKRLLKVPTRARLVGIIDERNYKDYDETSHIFNGTLWKGVARLQICDITDPDVVRIVESGRGVRKSVDVYKDGWFENSVLETIRKIVRHKIMQQTGRETEGSNIPDLATDPDLEEPEAEYDDHADDGESVDDSDADDDDDEVPETLGVAESEGQTSRSVSSKIDELMQSLQSTTSFSGLSNTAGIIDENEDDEFDYFDDDDG